VSTRSRDKTYGRRGSGWVPEGHVPGQAAAELAAMRAEREAEEARRQREADQRGEQLGLLGDG
jgi:hypothetical protein